jgi:GNAT superfamily N-acetyltransferase
MSHPLAAPALELFDHAEHTEVAALESMWAEAPAALSVARWRVEAIGPERALDFGRINATAFGEPPLLEAWSAAIVGKPDWTTYLADDRETPIACAGIRIAGGVAWMGMAGTLEAYRGRGAQSALIARRLADAREWGCHLVVLETAEDHPDKPAPSYRNQIRFGFRPIYARENWLLAGGLAAPVTPQA